VDMERFGDRSCSPGPKEPPGAPGSRTAADPGSGPSTAIDGESPRSGVGASVHPPARRHTVVLPLAAAATPSRGPLTTPALAEEPTPLREPPAMPVAPSPAVAAVALAPPPPAPTSPAPPPFDVARATVEVRTPVHLDHVGATGVNAAIGHVKTAIAGCYKRALPTLDGPLDGAETLHIETDDDGWITRARVMGGVRGSVPSCIEAAVQGAHISGVDTGAASADIPLELRAR
jgi:hypothetical protein